VNDDEVPAASASIAVWQELLGAVDYLSQRHRPGIGVWDAIEEAIRWWSIDRLTAADGFPDAMAVDLPWHDPDPLRSGIERLLAAVGPAGTTDGHPLGDVLAASIAVWLDQMAQVHNDGQRFSTGAFA
jgi:hypothetical protein